MKLILADDNGNILDSTDDFSREEWDNLSPMGAKALLDDLSAGA